MGLPLLGIIEQVSQLAGGVMDRVWPTDADKMLLEQAKTQLTLELQKQALNEKSDFRHFMLAYEGAAKDMPWIIQVLRASVRPILTYLLMGTTAWLVWQGREIPTKLYQLDMLCCAFWFGERAVTNYIKAKK